MALAILIKSPKHLPELVELENYLFDGAFFAEYYPKYHKRLDGYVVKNLDKDDVRFINEILNVDIDFKVTVEKINPKQLN